ncbi:anti-sigma factor domain-containing protein [Pseudonocardia alaniniphila]|uniref:Regulator of SigK n=1 Tax=Pseudonocardia alaniniphila TaxID=75291 RepID=A0ABS9TD87_9PSEU|nr:anti-sigma factor [Pseudonocardia alaniniphila]MCH6166363.1 anti-sigma factor [Pseudonocardia alaniniphila]
MNDQAVGWALNALEPDEEQAMQAHLPGCRFCRDVVRETELVMGELATSVEPVDPPARLRDDILAQAARIPQLGREKTLATGRQAGLMASDARVPGNDRPTLRDRGHPRRRWLSARLVAVAAAVTVVFGVGGLAVYTAQVQQQRDAQIAQSQSLADLVAQLDRPGTSHAMLSTDAGRTLAAVLVTASDRTVVTTGLPPNDRNDTIYVLWGLGAGDPRPLGSFDVTAPGSGVQGIDSPAGEPAFPSYAISLEPGRDVPAAPTALVAHGAVHS